MLTTRTFKRSIWIVATCLTSFGLLLPYLFSQPSDLSVALGVILLLGTIWLLLFPLGVARDFERWRRSLSAMAVLALLGATACSKVPAGHVGVKVHLLGTSKGIDHEELGIGRYWIGINEELYLFPTFVQNRTWTKEPPTDESITFQTIEGLEVNGDFGVTYAVDPKKISLLFNTYRKGIEEITDIYLRNVVRDEVVAVSSKMKVESVYGEGKEDMMAEVNKRAMSRVAEKGILVDKIYIIGGLRLPQTVIDSLNKKIEATQKAMQVENEVREERARAEKIVVAAEATAKANRLIADSISQNPAIVRWRELDVQQLGITKWNGVMPQFAGGAATPLIQLPTGK